MRKRIALAVLLATTIGCGTTNVASGLRGVYAVDDYGAVHDGRTDDGPAIRAAIADAVKTGGIVAFGPGVYAFGDSLVVAASSITLRGIGRADEHDLDSGRGTVLFHRPLSKNTGGTAVRIGYRDVPTIACAIQDLTLRGSTGNTGTLLSMAGVQYCSLERVDLFHNASTAPGNAALLVTCEAETAPTTGCWFEQLHVYAAKNDGGEGDAIRIECASSGYTTDLNFLHVKTNNATPPGKSVRIVRAESGVNANHRFVSCRFDAKAGATGVLVEAPRCSFLGCTIDNPTGADRLLEFVASGSDGVWIGNVDGTVLDELAGKRSAATIQGTSRATPNEKAASR